jgi:hypothetical protein
MDLRPYECSMSPFEKLSLQDLFEARGTMLGEIQGLGRARRRLLGALRR